MAEELVLTDPIVPDPVPPTHKYMVVALTLDLETVVPNTLIPSTGISPSGTITPEAGLVSIKVKDDVGRFLFYQYTGKLATNMIKQLSTINLTTKSLQKRILEKLAADGLIPPGTIDGMPDPPTVIDHDLE